MIRYSFLMIVFLFQYQFAFADAKVVGNGGDVITCPDGRIMLYDYYEAESRHHIKITLGETDSFEENLEKLLQRLERINPIRVRLYRFWMETFFDESEFLSGVDLNDIPDTGDGFVPSGCKLVQAVIQRNPYFPNEKRFTFSREVWERLSGAHRAGLVFHELLLREATTARGHENSILVRYFNSTVASDRIQKMSLREFIRLIHLVRFQVADAPNGAFQVLGDGRQGCLNYKKEDHELGVVFHNDSLIRCARLADGMDLLGYISVQGRLISTPVNSSPDSHIEYSSAGKLQTLNVGIQPLKEISTNQIQFLSATVSLKSSGITKDRVHLKFNESGLLTDLDYYYGMALECAVSVTAPNCQSYTLARQEALTFLADGSIQAIWRKYAGTEPGSNTKPLQPHDPAIVCKN